MNLNQENQIPFIRELCYHKPEEEIKEAEDNFRAYLELIEQIHQDQA